MDRKRTSGADLPSPTRSNTSKKSKTGGYSSIKSREQFEETYGKLPGEFLSENRLFGNDNRPHGPKPPPVLSLEVQNSLLTLASRAVLQFKHIIFAGQREKPLYVFFSALFASLRHGSMIISPGGLQDEEGDDDDEEEREEASGVPQGRNPLAASDSFVQAFEEDVTGETLKGPVEIVILRAPNDDVREIALQEGLCPGLVAGCEAAVAMEIKPTARFCNVWQALAVGVELALKNRKPGKEAAPVSVILSDACIWYFFSLQALGPSLGQGQQAGAVEAGRAAGGLVFELKRPGCPTGEMFRLFNCTWLQARMLPTVTDTSAAAIIQVMYRLYVTLYPDEDINKLPELVAHGDARAVGEAEAWVRRVQEVAMAAQATLLREKRK